MTYGLHAGVDPARFIGMTMRPLTGLSRNARTEWHDEWRGPSVKRRVAREAGVPRQRSSRRMFCVFQSNASAGGLSYVTSCAVRGAGRGFVRGRRTGRLSSTQRH